MGKFVDISGRRYGRLTVIGLVPDVRKNSHRVWLCKCDCGNTVETIRNRLEKGYTRSCGCLQKEIVSKRSKTHGMSDSRLYVIWNHMIRRCEKPNNASYADYGGRGISVCKEWHDSSAFIEWALENGYRDNLTIERIDVNGNYEPSNCKWITKSEQGKNTRRNVRISLNGRVETLADWARIINIPYATIESRYLRGLPPKDILFKGRFKTGTKPKEKEVQNGIT